MEEGSEKRRERLQSLRAQAAAGASPGPPPPPSPSPSRQLSNPLIQPPPASSPASIQRFDYYTDPMSAFSDNKRRGSGGHHPRPRSTRPRGYSPSTPQYHMNRPPNQDFYHMPFPVPQHNSWRSPVQFGSPYSGHTDGQFYSHHDINASVHSPGPGGFRTPMMNTGVRSPHPGRFRSSPSPGMSSGRGRGPGRGSGRGLGYYGGSTSQENFYQKSMVDDPWRDLKPVVGNILVPRAGPDFWLPKSIALKKPSVSETANEFKREASLTEYLALSLEETVNDDTVA